jgi:hypothetical protein
MPGGEVFGQIGQISVDIDGLKDTAAKLQGLLEQSYRVQVPKVYDAMRPGARVGGELAADEWAGLQDSYTKSIEGTASALQNIDLGTQALAKAAEAIANQYGSSDAFAVAQAKDVEAVLPTPQPREIDESERGRYIQ